MNNRETIRMTRSMLKCTTVLGMFVLLVGCGKTQPAPEEFCAAASAYDKVVKTASDQEQLRLWKKITALSPAEIKSDAEIVLSGYEAALAGEKVGDEKLIEKASRRVQRFTIDGCGFYESDSPL